MREAYWAKLGEPVRAALSPEVGGIEQIDPETYYAHDGFDGRPLRVPADLDDSICRYMNLSKENRDRIRTSRVLDGSGITAGNGVGVGGLRFARDRHRGTG